MGTADCSAGVRDDRAASEELGRVLVLFVVFHSRRKLAVV